MSGMLDIFRHDFLGDKGSWLFDVALYAILGLSTLFTIILVTLPSQYDPYKDKPLKAVNDRGEEVELKRKDGKKNVTFKAGRTTQIVVLGDIGRSPRMQYHAISIAKHGAKVYLVGYRESEIHPDVLSNDLITIVPLNLSPSLLRSSSKLLFPILAPLKALHQSWTLYRALGYVSPPARYMLVQNPPSIPTLAIASLVSFLRNTELVIDWHNFGYTILALKLGASHLLVRISAVYEKLFARLAAQHITVTNAMARVLKDDYGVAAHALHDRPAALFRPLNNSERNAFLATLPETAQYAPELAAGSWKLIVSSTSWTADEDFSLLLAALESYSARATSQTSLPNILAIITGKGPQKEHYLQLIRKMNQERRLLNVVIATAWLSAEDYAKLLGAADLGVSLHMSSSGVDLPMKVVDMFGAGLPVVGWGEFEAWPELVKEDVNGKGFGSSEQLAGQLVELFGSEGSVLATLKKGAVRESENRWDDEWDRVGGTLFRLV